MRRKELAWESAHQVYASRQSGISISTSAHQTNASAAVNQGHALGGLIELLLLDG